MERDGTGSGRKSAPNSRRENVRATRIKVDNEDQDSTLKESNDIFDKIGHEMDVKPVGCTRKTPDISSRDSKSSTPEDFTPNRTPISPQMSFSYPKPKIDPIYVADISTSSKKDTMAKREITDGTDKTLDEENSSIFERVSSAESGQESGPRSPYPFFNYPATPQARQSQIILQDRMLDRVNQRQAPDSRNIFLQSPPDPYKLHRLRSKEKPHSRKKHSRSSNRRDRSCPPTPKNRTYAKREKTDFNDSDGTLKSVDDDSIFERVAMQHEEERGQLQRARAQHGTHASRGSAGMQHHYRKCDFDQFNDECACLRSVAWTADGHWLNVIRFAQGAVFTFLVLLVIAGSAKLGTGGVAELAATIWHTFGAVLAGTLSFALAAVGHAFRECRLLFNVLACDIKDELCERMELLCDKRCAWMQNWVNFTDDVSRKPNYW